MTVHRLKQILFIWFCALMLLITAQLGAVFGGLFNAEFEMSRTLCLNDFDPLNQHIDIKTGSNLKIVFTERANNKCSIRAVEMVVHYRGSVFKFFDLDDQISEYLSTRRIQTSGHSLRTKPVNGINTLYGFFFSAVCAMAFLLYQRRKTTYIQPPQLDTTFQVAAFLTTLCLAGLVVFVWMPFQLFAEHIRIPNYLFVNPEELQANTMLLIFSVVLAPLCEEIIFRAWLLEAWQKFMRPWLALTMSSIAFSLVHPMGLVANTIFIIPGLLLGGLWLKTRSLLACISAHALYNAFVLLTLSRNA